MKVHFTVILIQSRCVPFIFNAVLSVYFKDSMHTLSPVLSFPRAEYPGYKTKRSKIPWTHFWYQSDLYKLFTFRRNFLSDNSWHSARSRTYWLGTWSYCPAMPESLVCSTLVMDSLFMDQLLNQYQSNCWAVFHIFCSKFHINFLKVVFKLYHEVKISP